MSIIKGLAGLIIWTDNLDVLLNFYRDVLQLVPHSVKPDFISFKWGDTRLNIGTHSDIKGCSKDQLRIMVNLRVKDIRAAYNNLQERGIDFIRLPEQENWGGWICTLSDPDGNIIQLVQDDRNT
jgi:predicted enzyme related to lactoylglutathione lyase